MIKQEYSYIYSYVKNISESESAISSTWLMQIVLDANYEKSELNKVVSKQCQTLNQKNAIDFYLFW